MGLSGHIANLIPPLPGVWEASVSYVEYWNISLYLSSSQRRKMWGIINPETPVEPRNPPRDTHIPYWSFRTHTRTDETKHNESCGKAETTDQISQNYVLDCVRADDLALWPYKSALFLNFLLPVDKYHTPWHLFPPSSLHHSIPLSLWGFLHLSLPPQ